MRSHPLGSTKGIVTLILLLAPLLGFFALTSVFPGWDARIVVPQEHFVIVSGASLAALTIAILIGIASIRTREPQTCAVSMGFLFIAGIFSVHGLATPGEGMLIAEMHDSIVISARLSLFAGSLFFLMAAFRPSALVIRLIGEHHVRITVIGMVLVAAYVGANLAKPDLLDWVPTGQERTTQPTAPAGAALNEQTVRSQPRGGQVYTHSERIGRGLAYAMAVIASAAFLLAAWRFFDTYAYTRTPATLAMAVGLLLLAEGQVIMALGEVWHLSWWIYHGAILAGFVIPVAGIAVAYRRGSNLTEIVDGLFVRDTLARMERQFPEAINALIGAIEARDPYTRGHMRRVAQLTLAISEEMGIPQANARAASHAALLHDIGKLGIPESVLHKPGRLTDEEFALLKQHAARGHQMVNQAPALLHAAPAIRWHHERLDGTGYPDGIRGDEIPLEARIVAVADVWDALTSDRVYRDAMSEQTARKIVASEAGAKLDAACVAALFNVLDRQDRSVMRPTFRQQGSDQPSPQFLAS